jgi:hypothetical protein
MRGIVSISATLLALAIAASPAMAEPPSEDGDTKSAPATVRVGPFGGLDFSGVTALQAPSPEPTVPDLFPPSLFGDSAVSLSMGGSNERRNGYPLPDDADWRVQATQVGAMVFGFAALAALCSGGGCMLPSSWLPDQLQAEPHFTPDPLAPNEAAGRDLGR